MTLNWSRSLQFRPSITRCNISPCSFVSYSTCFTTRTLWVKASSGSGRRRLVKKVMQSQLFPSKPFSSGFPSLILTKIVKTSARIRFIFWLLCCFFFIFEFFYFVSLVFFPCFHLCFFILVKISNNFHRIWCSKKNMDNKTSHREEKKWNSAE